MKNGPVISIVDDDHSVRHALQRLVRSAGYSAETFGSAEDFLESLIRGCPVCLILDIHLDGMSGFSLQERLTEDGMDIPVIFISAHDDPITRQRVTMSGAIDCLWKPLDQRELLDAIGRAVGNV